MHSVRATTPLWAACVTPLLRVGKKGGSAGHVRRDTPIGQIAFIGNFRRRLARELLVYYAYLYT